VGPRGNQQAPQRVLVSKGKCGYRVSILLGVVCMARSCSFWRMDDWCVEYIEYVVYTRKHTHTHSRMIVMDIARKHTINRMKRCATIMGRQEGMW
jgi:hypothetical protein